MAAEKKKVARVKKEVKKIDINKDEVVKEIKEELTTKIKKEITKEIIDDMKKDVSALVREDVTNELKKDLEKEIKKGSRRVLRSKRGKIFRRDIIIIVLLCIIGYLIYYMYNHNYVSFSINSNMNNIALTNDKKQVKKDNDYSYLLDIVNVKLPFDNNNSLYLYTNNYNEKNINSSIKLTMAYNFLNKDEFSKEELKDAYIKLFGTDKNYKDTSFEYECKKYSYDINNDTYALTNNECIGISSKQIIEKIIKISKKNNKVIITTVMGVYDSANKSLYNYKNIYEPIAVDLNNNFDITDYQNKLNTYEYTFKLNNDEYYFDSVKNM